jgi:hypothetical protein
VTSSGAKENGVTIKHRVILMKIDHPELTQEQIAIRLQTPTPYVWRIL